MDVIDDRPKSLVRDSFTEMIRDGIVGVAHDPEDGGEITRLIGDRSKRMSKCSVTASVLIDIEFVLQVMDCIMDGVGPSGGFEVANKVVALPGDEESLAFVTF